MLRMLEAQAPAKQTATDTINTLSSRLSSATLLEDRRAAILGLRSFAKRFPASVASGALRDLLAALQKDGGDSDTVKVVLETLLMLFEPDEASPEASEEITLWMADEFSMRQDNITALLDLLETGEFYLRLYSLQILSHVCAARPERAHEAVLAAPLGVSRITAVLDDRREPVRNEALLLLGALTPASAELQKVVAFENAFDRILALIEGEGGLTHGSSVVQDCLSLLANLLRLNTSNQAYFREIGCIAKVSKLLADVVKEESSAEGVADWIKVQRDMNVWGLLGVLQLFLVRGSQASSSSQTAMWQNRVLLHILQIAFHPSFGNNVRAKSLETCGAVIRGNASLQEQFGDLFVPFIEHRENTSLSNGHTSKTPSRASASGPGTPAPGGETNVIEALLQLTLEPASLSIFDIRLAACDCIKSFIEGHDGIRAHVLRRAIEGHQSGEDAIPNILTVLLESVGMRSNSDPYQVWMASVLLLHLLHENSETKTMARNISEGNADEGEEVVTFIQSIASNVVAGVQHVEDERALLGYLMLLSVWLFEDPDAVNDLLSEGSNVQGLAAAVKVSSSSMPLVAGLCSFLVGVVYEFSTKDSPIPRAKMHSVLMKSLTREVYVDRLTKLRESPFVRDFEILPINPDGGLPDVYFDTTFMDFMKDNFSRILRAIDRDPAFEASIVANGIQKGVSRELVDGLRAELEEHKRTLEAVQQQLLDAQQRLEQEELEHRRTRESTSVELGRIKQINDSLQRNHDDEVGSLRQETERRQSTALKNHEQAVAQMRREHETALSELTKRHQKLVDEVNQKHLAEKRYLEQRQSGHEREIVKLRENFTSQHKLDLDKLSSQAAREKEESRSEIERVRQEAEQMQRQLQAELATVRQDLLDAENRLSETRIDLARRSEDAEKQAAEATRRAESSLKEAEQRANAAESQLEKLESHSKATDAKLQTANQVIKDAISKTKQAEEATAAAEKATKHVEEDLRKAQERVKKLEQDLKKANEKPKAGSNKSSKEADDKIQKLQAEVDALSKQVDDLKPAAEKTKDVQTELDDLLVVFADLETKRASDKKRLKELGEDVSEDEDEDEDDGEVGEDEDGDQDEDGVD